MSLGGYELVEVPLVEATIEVRFPGDARIDAIRGEFQHAVAQDFPQLYLPAVAAGESPGLMPYRFQNNDGTKILALALHSLAYTTMQYPGWEAFKREFLGFWSTLSAMVAQENINRVGARFINRFDGPFHDCLAVESLPDYLSPLRDGTCDFYRVAGNYRRGETRILVNVHRPEHEESLLLDYDAYAQSVPIAFLEETLESLHSVAETEFQSALRGEYKDRLFGPKAGGA